MAQSGHIVMVNSSRIEAVPKIEDKLGSDALHLYVT